MFMFSDLGYSISRWI